jgi:hypothetical protein
MQVPAVVMQVIFSLFFIGIRLSPREVAAAVAFHAATNDQQQSHTGSRL